MYVIENAGGRGGRLATTMIWVYLNPLPNLQ